MCHPECRPEVVDLADKVASTAGMIKFAGEVAAREFIVGTESGIMHQLRKQCPGKQFYLATEKLVCPNMKSTTLPKVRWALEDLKPVITVPTEIRAKALNALERMLAIK